MAPKSRYLPLTDPDEIRLEAKWKQLGALAPSLGELAYESGRYPTSLAVAEMFADEFWSVEDWSKRATILECISKPEFRSIALPLIITTLRKEGGNGAGQFAANDLSRIATMEDVKLLEDLLFDEQVGETRSLLVPTFAKIAKTSGIPVLRELVHDSVTRSEALKHLSILGDVSIEGELLKLALHPDSYHRQIARAALKRVEKAKLKAAQRVVN